MLALIRARDFDEALEIANNTEYGLTGALSQHGLRAAGTGAAGIPCRQSVLQPQMYRLDGRRQNPFGGFNMSGTDSKAGGPDYLLLFTQAKSITEKL